jgi:hypothetical protein
MKKTNFFLLLLLAFNCAQAQENLFVIYSIKGNVSVIENKTETRAKVGTMMTNNGAVKIGPGSFATLICNETRMFSLSKPGTFSAASLKDSCKGSSGSVSSNYAKYIWTELTKSKGTPEKNRKNYMANVGAVSRGINNVWIDPKLDTINYVSGTLPLSWKSYTDAQEFEFRLYDEAGKNILFKKPVTKKNVPVSEIAPKLTPGKSYTWSAMIKGEENEERKVLNYWPKEKFQSYYSGISTTAAKESEAEKEFRLGFTLEESHFLAEAYTHYLKATQLAPDNVLYRSVFMSFKKDYEIK